MHAVTTTGLTKHYGKRPLPFVRPTPPIRALDIAVREGEIFGFLGPNGAGKSTTDATELASISSDIRLVGDPRVRRLAGPGERRCLVTDSGQLNLSVGGDERPPDLGLDFVVAALACPAFHQPSITVEEILRRPCVVVQSPPDRALVVDRNWIGQLVVANPAIDVLGALAEFRLTDF